jgi:membrane protein
LSGDGSGSGTSRRRAEEARERSRELKHRLAHRIEVERTHRPWVGLFFEFAERDQRHAATLLAGGLAFRLFLWLVSFSLVAVSVLGLFADVGAGSPEEVAQSAGLSAALVATVARATAQTNQALIVLLLVGTWGTLWAARGVTKSLRIVHQITWQIRLPWSGGLIRVPAVFSGVMAVLIAVHVAAQSLYAGPWQTDLLVDLGLVALVSAAALWAELVLPRPPETIVTALLPGAVLIGAGFELLRLFAALYLVRRLENVNDLYGSLGIAVVMLTWLYLIARLWVAGPMLNATLWGRRAASTGSPG